MQVKGICTMSTAQLDLSYPGVMSRKLLIPTPRGGAFFDVVGASDVAYLAGFAKESPAKRAIRITGGCKLFTPELKGTVFAHFAQGFGDPTNPEASGNFVGMVSSGVTMEANGDPMITQVPAYLARLFKIYSWGTCPRTDRMVVKEDTGGLSLNKYDTTVDRFQHQVGVFQKSPADVLEWDGDVEAYLDAHVLLREELDFAVGIAMANGGEITLCEALKAIARKIPVIVVRGTLRAADDFAEAFGKGSVLSLFDAMHGKGKITPAELEVANSVKLSDFIHIAEVNDPTTMNAGLRRFDLIAA